MKRASGVEFLEENGVIYGFILQADYAAEHEHGIDRILCDFGIKNDETPLGIASRTIPNGVILPLSKGEVKVGVGKNSKKTEVLIVSSDDEIHDRPFSNLSEQVAAYSRDEEIVAEWSDKAFIIGAYSDDAKAALTLIRESFANGDIAIWMYNSINPFGRGGLAIAIPSLIPKYLKDQMLENDRDAAELRAAVQATGIMQKLEENNRRGSPTRYYSCIPKWADEGRGDVMFLLNPFVGNRGCYTAGELAEWLSGGGPVIDGNTVVAMKK